MPTNVDLSKVLQDTGQYQAEYKPAQTTGGSNAPKPSSCVLPTFDDDSIVITPFEKPIIEKDCLLPLIPEPVIPPPYIDVTDLETPCAPDGFNFRSNDTGTGTVAHDPTVTGTARRTDTVWFLQGTGTLFVSEIYDVMDAGSPPPQIEIEVSGEKYLSRVHSVANDTQLYLSQKFKKTDGTELATAQTGKDYVIKRIVFTTDNTKPTGGSMFFIKTDEIGCAGAFVGEVNLDLSVSVPCPNGPTVEATINTDPIATADDWKVPVRNALIPCPDPRNLQKFGYEITSSPCQINLNLDRPAEIMLPDIEVVITTADNNLLPDTVTLTKTYSNPANKITFAGTIKRGGAGGGGSTQCCVWQ